MKHRCKILFIFILTLLAGGCSAQNIQESESMVIFRSIAISPDGRYIAAGRDIFNIVFLYDAKTLEVVKYLRGEQEDIWGKMKARTLDFSPDGRYLAAGGIDDAVVVWDVASGKQEFSFKDLKKPLCITFSPDGRTLAIAGPDHGVRLVGMSSGKVESILQGHQGATLSATFSPAGNILLTGGSDKVLRLWDLRTKSQITEYEGHTAPVERITFSPKGDRMVSASKSELKHWQIASQEGTDEDLDIEGFRVQTAALNVFVNLLGVINFAHSGLAYRHVVIELQEPLSADYSPDEKYLAITAPSLTFKGQYELRIKNLETGESRLVPGQFFAIAVDPNGEYVATVGNGLKLWDLESGERILRKAQNAGK